MIPSRIDILKQPILMLLVTFIGLLVAVVLRSLAAPLEGVGNAIALSPLGEWIDGDGSGGPLGLIVGVVATIASSIVITRITGRYSLSVIRSFVPMVLYMVCVGSIIYPLCSPSMTLALLMIIHATELMIVSFRRTEEFGCVMRASFWIGVAVVLIPDLIYVAILLPLQWVVWKRSVREMVAATTTLLLPMFYASVGYWFYGKTAWWFIQQWGEALSRWHTVDWVALYQSLGSIWGAILLGATTLLTLAGLVVFTSGYTTMRIRARKGHVIFSATYLMGLAMLLIVGLPAALSVPIMGIGSVPIIYTFFVKYKSAISAIMYIGMVALSLVVSFVG